MGKNYTCCKIGILIVVFYMVNSTVFAQPQKMDMNQTLSDEAQKLIQNKSPAKGIINGIDTIAVSEALIPGGEFDMGDHFGFVDPSHPSDETPIHKVKIDSMYMSKTIATNQQFLAFLNSTLLQGLIEVRNNTVYAKGGTDIYYYTNKYASDYSIGYDGKVFSIVDFRANHPVVGVMWLGAAAFCNWLSLQNGLDTCYNLKTWNCDFTKNGYRLPTEAEWENAGRGGHTNPYFNYPNGNTIFVNSVNLPSSGDPYETGPTPQTTPVGFYDGKLKLKSDYDWPGTASSYQTTDGANGFGLYDMQGNVWEFINDWYGQDYYSKSPYDNPKGPDSSFKMPDGKPYRGMRGGNWYNGQVINGVNDGHSRVSNRDPSYYRGPQDPNQSWNMVGFRVARNYSVIPNTNHPPDKPDKPSSKIEGFTKENMSFTSKTTDIDGDSVSYFFDWGDTTNSGWLGVFSSGVEISASHSWTTAGNYIIKVKAKDTKNAESNWSDDFQVKINQKDTTLVFESNSQDQFELYQNYPNPFNSVTGIKFSLPVSEHVVVKIYNEFGEELCVLVNAYLAPGNYSYNWDSRNYPSGIYYYKLQYDKQVLMKKMILIK